MSEPAMTFREISECINSQIRMLVRLWGTDARVSEVVVAKLGMSESAVHATYVRAINKLRDKPKQARLLAELNAERDRLRRQGE